MWRYRKEEEIAELQLSVPKSNDCLDSVDLRGQFVIGQPKQNAAIVSAMLPSHSQGVHRDIRESLRVCHGELQDNFDTRQYMYGHET